MIFFQFTSLFLLFVLYSLCFLCTFYVFVRRMETVKYSGTVKDKVHEEKFELYIEVSTEVVDGVFCGSEVHILELCRLLRARFLHVVMASHPCWRCARCWRLARGALNGMMFAWHHRSLHVIDEILPVCVQGGVCMRKLIEDDRKCVKVSSFCLC